MLSCTSVCELVNICVYTREYKCQGEGTPLYPRIRREVGDNIIVDKHQNYTGSCYSGLFSDAKKVKFVQRLSGKGHKTGNIVQTRP